MRGRLPVARAVLCAVLASMAGCGPTDPALQIAIDSQLAADPLTADLSVDIAVTRGVARLEGQVDSVGQRRRALTITRDVPGLKDVIDAMYPSDDAIVDAVRSALTADSLVGRIPITVTAQHGKVQLISDQTGKDDRVRAVELASRVDGVKQVEDLMR